MPYETDKISRNHQNILVKFDNKHWLHQPHITTILLQPLTSNFYNTFKSILAMIIILSPERTGDYPYKKVHYDSSLNDFEFRSSIADNDEAWCTVSLSRPK